MNDKINSLYFPWDWDDLHPARLICYFTTISHIGGIEAINDRSVKLAFSNLNICKRKISKIYTSKELRNFWEISKFK
jgi:hypothetical protein